MDRASKPGESNEHDSGWKKVISSFFPSFMAFYYPKIFELIDWDKEWVFLDKALEKIRKDQKVGKKKADKLVRIFLKNGKETWLLIHIEVQVSYQSIFRKRVFVYNYRIYDKYDIGVISLAILGDARPSWRPTSFSYGCGDAQTRIDFLSVKLLDYQKRWEELEASDNPFAIVTMAHLRTMQTRKNPEERYAWKLALIRTLFSKGWRRDDIIELLDFMDYIMILPDGLDKKLLEELNNKEGEGIGESQMEYINSWRKVGREEGREVGLEEGREVGLQEMLSEIIREKFGQVPSWVAQRLSKADDATLLGWGKAMLKIKKLEDLFA